MTQTLFAAPLQLPPETVHFVGRERLVAQVQSVQPGRVVSAVGAGRTGQDGGGMAGAAHITGIGRVVAALSRRRPVPHVLQAAPD